jgi:hypothetical protein
MRHEFRMKYKVKCNVPGCVQGRLNARKYTNIPESRQIFRIVSKCAGKYANIKIVSKRAGKYANIKIVSKCAGKYANIKIVSKCAGKYANIQDSKQTCRKIRSIPISTVSESLNQCRIFAVDHTAEAFKTVE